jgi:hypothetical protein
MKAQLWLLLAIVVGGPASYADAQTVRIPRTNVAMTAPPGFKVAREFTGLEDPETGATIRITELAPEAYADLAAALSSPKTASDRYASQGIRITRIEPLAVGDTQAPLAIGGAEVKNQPVAKYMTVLGGASVGARTVWVVVDVPATSTLRRADVEAALQSIKITRLPTLAEKLARLAFRFEPHAPFQITDASATSALLTLTGKPVTANNEPLVLIERAGTTAIPSETAKLNEQILRRQPSFGSAQITEQGNIEFVGGEAHYLVATSGPLTAYQIVRIVPGGRYFRLYSIAEASAAPALRDALNAIAASVTQPE